MDIDEDINTNDTSTPAPPQLGPITRARARQLNHQVSSFLTSCPLYLYNRNTHTLFLLRNDGDDKEGERLCVDWFRTAGQHQLVTAPTISSRLRLGRSSTSWKAFEVYFLMDPTLSSDSFGAMNYPQNDVRTSILGLSLLYLIQPTRGPF